MIGAVLCGGQSIRMGSDKGLLKYQSKTWAQVAFDKLNQLQLPVDVSINKDQLPEYSAIFSSQSLIADDESVQNKGPLTALLSIHLKRSSDDLMILACDMPLMEMGLLEELLIQRKQHANFDAFIYTNDDEPEPLCGIYKAKSLSKMLHLYQTGQLAKHSMKYVLDQINTFPIPLPGDKKKYFQNLNTPSEANEL